MENMALPFPRMERLIHILNTYVRKKVYLKMELKNNGYTFLDCIKLPEKKTTQFLPLQGSFALIECEQKYLLCYNTWRKQWEIPAGKREQNETPLECAVRELYEETGQLLNNMTFKGLLKVQKKEDKSIKFNPIFHTSVKKLQPFVENNETSKIKLWDLNEDIGTIDEVDFALLNSI